MPNPADRPASRTIRNVLVIARQASGRSQRDVADAAGCQPHQLDAWENAVNTPGIDKLAAWAAALGYEIALLPKGADRAEG
ncbi:helix-turn-helix domain-containing protein [Catellatospora coxensis]|uniref:HTH cro/C1-type domain-containing protein n=1 Tax=Catellatospora coxensis TaxID=310354 RepID=A0A8J3KWC2_9ACTN|nr:helix-turn-helix transcriptional regulator [Catellatospora coxensis]GIG10197.1 hypothetical protein Cco03nite_68970 [Catellatospora coxensis]